MKPKRGKQTLRTKPLYPLGHMVNVVSDVAEGTATVLDRKWAGSCWYYMIMTLGGTSWVLESQLSAPAEVMV